MLICGLTNLIYTDYLVKFRGEDIYFVKDKKTGEYKICNTDECYGNSNYGFE